MRKLSSGEGGRGEVKRLKYAVVRDSLAEAFTDLEFWQDIFDPSWLLMMKIAESEVDQQLLLMSQQQTALTHKETKTAIPIAQRLRRALKPVVNDGTQKTVFQPPGGLITESVRDLDCSSVRIAHRIHTGQLVVLDAIACTHRAGSNSALRDIRNFARRLEETDHFTFGLLQCKSIWSEEDSHGPDLKITNVPPPGFSFVFRITPKMYRV